MVKYYERNPMKQVLLILPAGFELMEASAFCDVFGWNMLAGDQSPRLVCAGKTYAIPTSFGHTMQADRLINEIKADDFDALALPGGFPRYGYFSIKSDPDFLCLLQAFANAGKWIAAVCTGALLLGAAGLLKGRRATTYAGEEGRWLEQLAAYGAIISEANPCVDETIITGGGPASAPQVALTLLDRLTDSQNAVQIGAMMGYNKGPAGIYNPAGVKYD
jgi:4-methyl-5(b-hydroxyethyl)-thiazole monophosphate biosynthesis